MRTNLNIKLIVLLLTCTALFSACKKDKNIDGKTIKYGTSFGMCVGFCTTALEISAEKTIVTGLKTGQSSVTTCTKTTDVEAFKDILNSINQHAFKKLPEVIGCPDCADGGAEWVEITINGKKHRVTFDYGKAPEILQKAVEKLRAASKAATCF